MAIIIEPEGRRVLFVHAPKTGGVWVETVLSALILPWRYAELNCDADRRHALPGMVAEDYSASFTFRRAPLSWHRSWWRFYHEHSANMERLLVERWHPLKPLLPFVRGTFAEYMDDVNRPSLRRFVPRMFDLYAAEGAIVGETETLPKSFVRVMGECGIVVDTDVVAAVAKQNTTGVEA